MHGFRTRLAAEADKANAFAGMTIKAQDCHATLAMTDKAQDSGQCQNDVPLLVILNRRPMRTAGLGIYAMNVICIDSGPLLRHGFGRAKQARNDIEN